MASDVLVSETVAGSNEYDIMTSNNGEQVHDHQEVDLMASPNSNEPTSSEDGCEQEIKEKACVDEEEIAPDQAPPAPLLKLAAISGKNEDEQEEETVVNGNVEQANGHHEENGMTNGNVTEPNDDAAGFAVTEEDNKDEKVTYDEQGNRHAETVVVKSEETTSPEGEVVTTTTTTVVKVDENSEGDTQITTTVKKTTLSYQSTELVVEPGASDQPVQSHELAAIKESAEPNESAPVSVEKPEEEAEVKEKDTAAEEKEQDAEEEVKEPTKEHKPSAARRLFNFVRSPAKQKSVDDPTQAAAADAKEKEKDKEKEAEKTKSPPHHRRLFGGWRKTWTPEKEGEEAGHEDGAGDGQTPKSAKKGKKSKQKSEDLSEGDKSADGEGEKVVSPKKKMRFGLMKKSKSVHTPSKDDKEVVPEKTATEKWQSEECTEHPATEEPKLDESAAAEKEQPKQEEPVKEEQMEQQESENKETGKAESQEEDKAKVEDEKVEQKAVDVVESQPESKETDESAKPTESESPKKAKKSSVRKSWTFRINRSQTEDEKLAAKSDTKEAPADLHPQSPSKSSLFASLLHRKKKDPATPSKKPDSADKAEKPEQPEEPVSELTATETKVAESASMPHLTPEKQKQTASEKWTAEGCSPEPALATEEDVKLEVSEPQSQSTAVKKDGVNSSPMRRSASLRMPSSLSRFFRFLGPRQRTTTVAGALGEEGKHEEQATTPPPSTSQNTAAAPHTTSLTTPVSPRNAQTLEAPASESKTQDVTSTPGRHSGGFRFWSNWRSSGGPGTFGRFRRKDKNLTVDGTQASHDDTSLIVNTSSAGPQKSATMHDMPKGDTPSVDLGAILARLPPHSPNEHSPTYIGISRVLNGYAEYNSPTKRSGASSRASHKSPGGTVTTVEVVETSGDGVEGGSLLQVVQQTTTVCSSSDIGRDAHVCLATADAEQTRLEAQCATVRSYLDAPELTPEARGQIEATIGKTNLLLSQKFKQFRELCHEATKPAVEGQPNPPNATDLAGFWDLVLIQVKDLDKGYEAIDQMKQNNWQKVEPVADTNTVPQKKSESGDAKKKQKKKKQEKSKSKQENDEATAESKAKSRFAEFKQRMFKSKHASTDKSAATAVPQAEAAPPSINGEAASTPTNGDASAAHSPVPVAEEVNTSS